MAVEQSGDWSKGLGGKVRRLLASFREKNSHRKEILAHLEQVVDIADPQIREVGGYRKTIYDHIEGITNYCSSIIGAIPGPVVLAKNNYYDDPTVRSMFASPDHLVEVISTSPDIRVLQKEGFQGQVVALLTMTMEEKTIFGHEQHGDIILRDVAQRAVNFTDHKLVAPDADLAAAKKGLSEHGLIVLATIAMEKITTLRSKLAGLREQQAYLEGAKKILSGKAGAHFRYTVVDPAMEAELEKATTKLEQTEQELTQARELYGGPSDSLRYLVDILSHPEQQIVLKPQVLRLNWMNVQVDSASGEGQDIALVEFGFPDNVKRSAIWVSLTV